MNKEKDLINTENTIKKSRGGSTVNRVYLKRNEELNIYDTVVETTTGYFISEYQKAYDINGNEIGEIKVKEYFNSEEEIGCYNYLNYKDTLISVGCKAIHFNNEIHLVVMDSMYTIDEIGDAVNILNKSEIDNIIFDCDYDFFNGTFLSKGLPYHREGFACFTDKKAWKEILSHKPDYTDRLITHYIEIIDRVTYSPFKWRNDYVDDDYSLNSNIQITKIGNSRCIYYLSEVPFDDEKYSKSVEDVKKIHDSSDIDYIYNTNKGLSKVNNDYKLIYHFDIDYDCNGNRLRICGVINNTIINEFYKTNNPNSINQIINFIDGLKKDGVYITKPQNKEIDDTLSKVKKDNNTLFGKKEVIKEEPRRIFLHRKETKTYLMKNKRNGLYKIGRSITPLHRERTLQSEEPEIKMVKVWDDNIEDTLHKKYDKHRVRGEWFNLTKTQVKYICTNKW